MNDLIIADPAEQARLAEALGANKGSGGGDRMPVLKVNTKRKDADGKKIPEGHFFVSGLDTPVYADKVKIRVLSHMFQWLHFDSEEKRLVNKTVLIPNFRVDPIDMAGGLRCGKPASKVFREMTKSEQKKFDDITCYRQLRLLVSYTGKTAAGEEVVVENQPAILMLKGSNFSPFDDEVMKRIPSNRNLYDFWVDVSTTEHENGSVTYYVMHFDPDLANPVGLDRTTLDTMYHLVDLIEGENKRVREAHDNALRKRHSYDPSEEAAIDALDIDFEDDVAA
jgi:hypothetical protein